MNLFETIRTMDKRLRVMLIASALLIVPLAGQFMTIAGMNKSGNISTLALFFIFTAIFIVPTSIILSSAILYTVRHDWRSYPKLAVIGAINILITLELTWFFITL